MQGNLFPGNIIVPGSAVFYRGFTLFHLVGPPLVITVEPHFSLYVFGLALYASMFLGLHYINLRKLVGVIFFLGKLCVLHYSFHREVNQHSSINGRCSQLLYLCITWQNVVKGLTLYCSCFRSTAVFVTPSGSQTRDRGNIQRSAGKAAFTLHLLPYSWKP